MPINESSSSARPRRVAPRHPTTLRQAVFVLECVGGLGDCRSPSGCSLLPRARTRPPRPRTCGRCRFGPGTGLGGQRVIVLPLSMIRHGDTFGFAEQITNPREYLVDLNAKIERGLTERAPRTVWVFPPALVQVASRQPRLSVRPVRDGSLAVRARPLASRTEAGGSARGRSCATSPHSSTPASHSCWSSSASYHVRCRTATRCPRVSAPCCSLTAPGTWRGRSCASPWSTPERPK